MWIIAAALLVGIVAAGFAFFFRPEKTVFYDVTFRDYDGSVLKSERVESGKSAIPPAEPKRDGFQFLGWNKDTSIITKDMIVTAEYIRITDTIFTVETITTSPGIANAEISISVTNNPGILGMLLSVSYDENVMKLVDSKNGVALSPLAFQKPKNYASGCNFVWYGSETGEVMDGEIMTLLFEISADAENGEYPITISWKDRGIFDGNCDMLNPDIIEGGVVIAE